jgi:hypothetical protein
MRLERERGDSPLCRYQPEIPAGMRGSGEEFRQPCGDLSEGKEGKRQRGSWAIYRHRLSSKWKRIKGEFKGE